MLLTWGGGSAEGSKVCDRNVTDLTVGTTNSHQYWRLWFGISASPQPLQEVRGF